AYSLLTTGNPSGFSYALQGNGDLWVLQGTTHVLTVTLNQSAGYTVSQVAPIDHPTGDLENNDPFTITFKVVDQDGQSDTGTFSISVDDDTPINFTPQPLTDKTGTTGTTNDDALVNDGTATATNPLNDTNNDHVGENFIGADGFGSLVFTATGHSDGEA